jgi:predicted enzyme related to lactoylglutathione lyase
MPRVVHFEIAADNPERAGKFYTAVFDWKINKWGGPRDYWLAETGQDGEPGINGGLMKRDAPSQTTVNTVVVSNLDQYIDKVQKSGGKLLTRHTIPTIGYLAYCTDTEGNPFGMLQPDENAK